VDKKEMVEMAGLNFDCPNCGKKVIFELIDEDKPIICEGCGFDLKDTPQVKEHIAFLKITIDKLFQR